LPSGIFCSTALASGRLGSLGSVGAAEWLLGAFPCQIQGQTLIAKSAIVTLMVDDDAVQRKRERLAVETYEYFWNICPALTERWRQAMFTLPPSVLQDISVEMKNLEAVTNAANQQLHAALGAGDEPPEDLLDGALASMERLNEAADTMTRLLDELLKA
jgi:hypothetical protein